MVTIPSNILSGAEPIYLPGGDGPLEGVGVLLCHGFTGTPEGMRPWAEYLANQGAAVVSPLLPGHGSTWQEMSITTYEDWLSVMPPAIDWLTERSDTLVVGGLSMGGALALRIAETYPVAGVMLVNPAVGSYRLDVKLAPILQHIIPSVPGVGSDIAKPGVTELSYERSPVACAASMGTLWKLVKADLHKVTMPVLLMTSREDHVVDGYTRSLLLKRLPHTEHHWLEHSYHVATLDHDADVIHALSSSFIAEVR